jgi:hypothetical protein
MSSLDATLDATRDAAIDTPRDTVSEMTEAVAYLERQIARTNAVLETDDDFYPEPMQDVQKLLALAVRLYVANYHAGQDISIFPEKSGVSATDVMIACTRMLEAVNVQLFELGMFQTWSNHSNH